jgi:hypothetical protein
MFYSSIHQEEACPEPCNKLMTYFGFPFISQLSGGDDFGYAKLYFKRVIKVTEDFLSYSLLR